MGVTEFVSDDFQMLSDISFVWRQLQRLHQAPLRLLELSSLSVHHAEVVSTLNIVGLHREYFLE